MLNNVCIMGRLTAAPEVKATANGVSVCSFSIACNRPKRNGEEPPPDFVDCVAWRGTADFVGKWFDKGDMIIVKGRLQTRSYDDKNGIRRKAVEVVAEEVNFGGKKNGTNHANDAESFSDVNDDDCPFS